jgi:DNA-binding SARP family transcriptional activator
MKAGPCGISCAICRLNTYEGIQFRITNSTDSLDLSAHILCPILQCATSHGITFCARDCSKFPCLLLERTIPFRWSMLATQIATGSLAGWRPGAPPDSNSDSETLRIFCLGQFRVCRGSVELQDQHWGQGKGPTHKIKALFAFLLSQKSQGATKQTITSLLWPQQTDPQKAANSFRRALFYLRRALEPDLQVGSDSSYIQRHGDRYYFAPQKPCWIDTDAFEFYAERALALEQRGDCAAAVVYWDKALDLYAGDFLTGIDSRYTSTEFYEWWDPHSFHFQQLYLKAKMALARHHLALQHYNLAIQYAREVLLIEPTFEQAHHLLMRCLIEINQSDNTLFGFHLSESELTCYQEPIPSCHTHSLFQDLVDTLRTT